MSENIWLPDLDAAAQFSDEELMQELRRYRNYKLSESDWTQQTDSTVDKAAWATYRQALRNLPAQNADPKKIVFPQPPA
jgi:hypothetical protein